MEDPDPSPGPLITTSVCIDEPGHPASDYMWSPRDPAARRRLYWLAAYVLCWTSRRWNPHRRHLVFTNDTGQILVEGVDLRAAFGHLEVGIVDLPFEAFDPGSRSRTYRNAFYKLDVIKALSQCSAPSLLLDSDCVWVRAAHRLELALGKQNQVVLQETKRITEEPHRRHAFGLSSADLGAAYARLDPSYPREYPKLYGGEIVGGRPEVLAALAEQHMDTFRRAMASPEAVTFPNGASIFDNDEFLTSFAYNRSELSVYDSMDHDTTRLATARHTGQRVSDSVLDIPIWHVPNEKQRGLPVLFRAIVSGRLDSVPDEDFARTIGGYLGVPRRTEHRATDLLDLAHCAYCHVKAATRIARERLVETIPTFGRRSV